MATIIPEKEVKYSDELKKQFSKYPFELSKFQKDSIKAFSDKKIVLYLPQQVVVKLFLQNMQY